MTAPINWQDSDSSSAKSFCYNFPNSSQSCVMLCGDHVGQALQIIYRSFWTRRFLISRLLQSTGLNIHTLHLPSAPVSLKNTAKFG